MTGADWIRQQYPFFDDWEDLTSKDDQAWTTDVSPFPNSYSIDRCVFVVDGIAIFAYAWDDGYKWARVSDGKTFKGDLPDGDWIGEVRTLKPYELVKKKTKKRRR